MRRINPSFLAISPPFQPSAWTYELPHLQPQAIPYTIPPVEKATDRSHAEVAFVDMQGIFVGVQVLPSQKYAEL